MGLQVPSVSSSKVILIKTVRLFLVFSRSCEGEMPDKVVSKEKWEKKLDLQLKAHQEGPQKADQELHLQTPLRNKAVHLFGTIPFSFIWFTYNKVLLWTVKFGLSS